MNNWTPLQLQMDIILRDVQNEIVEYFDITSEYGKGCLDTLSMIREKIHMNYRLLEELRIQNGN